MHPLIQQRREVLHSLRQRAAWPLVAMASGDTSSSALPSRVAGSISARPTRLPGARFQVLPQGGNLFNVVERSSGRLLGSRVGHVDACRYAAELERCTQAADEPAPGDGRTLTQG